MSYIERIEIRVALDKAAVHIADLRQVQQISTKIAPEKRDEICARAIEAAAMIAQRALRFMPELPVEHQCDALAYVKQRAEEILLERAQKVLDSIDYRNRRFWSQHWAKKRAQATI